MKFNLTILFLALLVACGTPKQNKGLPTITVKNKVLNSVDDKLFGQFMEKCSWGGEIGGDLVINPNTVLLDFCMLLCAMVIK